VNLAGTVRLQAKPTPAPTASTSTVITVESYGGGTTTSPTGGSKKFLEN
jgi:hypothetical protein